MIVFLVIFDRASPNIYDASMVPNDRISGRGLNEIITFLREHSKGTIVSFVNAALFNRIFSVLIKKLIIIFHLSLTLSNIIISIKIIRIVLSYHMCYILYRV